MFQSMKEKFSFEGEIDVSLNCNGIKLIQKVIKRPLYYKFSIDDISSYRAFVLTQFPL